jgi:hypothetical protein
MFKRVTVVAVLLASLAVPSFAAEKSVVPSVASLWDSLLSFFFGADDVDGRGEFDPNGGDTTDGRGGFDPDGGDTSDGRGGFDPNGGDSADGRGGFDPNGGSTEQ